MTKQELKQVLINYFNDHPEEDLTETSAVIQSAYQEAPLAHLKSYQPMAVENRASIGGDFAEQRAAKKFHEVRDQSTTDGVNFNGFD